MLLGTVKTISYHDPDISVAEFLSLCIDKGGNNIIAEDLYSHSLYINNMDDDAYLLPIGDSLNMNSPIYTFDHVPCFDNGIVEYILSLNSDEMNDSPLHDYIMLSSIEDRISFNLNDAISRISSLHTLMWENIARYYPSRLLADHAIKRKHWHILSKIGNTSLLRAINSQMHSNLYISDSLENMRDGLIPRERLDILNCPYISNVDRNLLR